MSLFQGCRLSEFFLSEALSASLGEQIDGCARSAEIMVKKDTEGILGMKWASPVKFNCIGIL